MATYAYKCSDCGKGFDVQATLQEKESGNGTQFKCPHCQSTTIGYRFSLSNFFKNIFKGEGKASGCCSGDGACDSGCKPKKEGGSCC